MPPRQRSTTPSKRAESPKVTTRKAASAKAEKDKKRSILARYQDLSIAYPFTVNLITTLVLNVAGRATALILAGDSLALQPLLEAGFLGAVCIAPVVYLWIGKLQSLKLHWAAATIVDQFMFSPIFNMYVFCFISAFFGGGVAFSTTSTAETSSLTLALHKTKFPSLTSWEPVHKTQFTAYLLWVPASIVRELYVPPALVPLFINVVAYVWNIIFSFILMYS